MNVTIETTADGSPTLYREDLDEHYHSVKGALSESLHVYVDCAWRKAAQAAEPNQATQAAPVRIFEVGFGTGLNAALTAQAATAAGKPTEYFSVELHPLAANETDLYARSLPEDLRDLFRAVNSAPWQHATPITPDFTLTKIHSNLLTMSLPQDPDLPNQSTDTLPQNLDAIYFDAFAPEKQPEMWSEALFRKLYNSMKPGAILTTYCAKGAIRRLLNQIGFLTERLPGPPAGKREILRATKPTKFF
ncbi:MAG: tRNA (5-methylaminomethyl-2-thiouridine)(34)-methyltransferase MnmD [Bacteroides sp.]|nr:tRNA (5-methylaminomethyl-2-thiouridine)(34)-methyltransferase MnmD [Bacteroides sp.]